MPSGLPSLKRSLSLTLVTLYGLGTIIGAGIYVLIGEVVAAAGYLTPAAFLLASIIAGFSAFSYAELSSRLPVSAGEAVYVERAFASRSLATLVGLTMVFIGVVASATLVRGFVGYFQVIMDLDSHLVMVLLVVAISVIAVWGITQSAWLAAMTTLIEIGGLLLILWVARGHFADLPVVVERTVAEISTRGWQGVGAGAFIAFFAFLGFEDIVNVAEETRHPRRNLPLAIILSLLISCALYIILAVISIATVPIDQLAGHDAPLALVYQTATGHAPTFLVLISIAAIVNGTLIMMIMASRILYGMSRQRWLPAWLARVNARTRTPLWSTLAVASLVLLFALLLPLETLAISTSLLTLAVFFMINLALLVIKRRDPAPPDALCYPRWIPIAGMISSAGFVGSQLLRF